MVAMVGEGADYRVELRDVYEGIEERGLDRIVLDLPEPWRVLPHAEVALRSGGILCAYLPTINQTAQFRHALEGSAFGMAGTLEVLHRTWHVEDRSVRPDHRMVGHTGFLTTARLLVPRSWAAGRRSGRVDAGASASAGAAGQDDDGRPGASEGSATTGRLPRKAHAFNSSRPVGYRSALKPVSRWMRLKWPCCSRAVSAVIVSSGGR